MGGKYITEFVIVSKVELDRKSEQEGGQIRWVLHLMGWAHLL